MLRSQPGAFLALDEALRDPRLCELRLAEPPAASQRLESVRLERPVGVDLAPVEFRQQMTGRPGRRSPRSADEAWSTLALARPFSGAEYLSGVDLGALLVRSLTRMVRQPVFDNDRTWPELGLRMARRRASSKPV